MADIETLLGMGLGRDDDMRAKASALRGQQALGDWLSLSQVSPIRELGKRTASRAADAAERGGVLRQTIEKRRIARENREQDREFALADLAEGRTYDEGQSAADDFRTDRLLDEKRTYDADLAFDNAEDELARRELEDNRAANVAQDKASALAKTKAAAAKTKQKYELEKIREKAKFKSLPAKLRKDLAEGSTLRKRGDHAIKLFDENPGIFNLAKQVGPAAARSVGLDLVGNALEGESLTDSQRAALIAGRDFYADVRHGRYGSALSAREASLGSLLDPTAPGVTSVAEGKNRVKQLIQFVQEQDDIAMAAYDTQDEADDTLSDLRRQLEELDAMEPD